MNMYRSARHENAEHQLRHENEGHQLRDKNVEQQLRQENTGHVRRKHSELHWAPKMALRSDSVKNSEWPAVVAHFY